jgi:hypothetical protein
MQSRRPSSSTSGRRPACAARSAGRRGRSHPPLRGARHWPPTGASSTSSRSERASRRPDPACAPIASRRSAGAAPIEAPTPAAAACPLPSDRRQDRARVLTTSVSTILAGPVASSQGRRTPVTRAQRRAQGGGRRGRRRAGHPLRVAAARAARAMAPAGPELLVGVSVIRCSARWSRPTAGWSTSSRKRRSRRS